MGPAVCFSWLAALHPNWYSAVPTMHQQLLRHGEELQRRGEPFAHTLKLIRNCSAALLPIISERMKALFSCDIL